MEQTLKY